MTLLFVGACRPDCRDLEPLLGRWETSDPRFEHCSLQVDAGGRIVLRQVDGSLEVLQVQEVAARPAEEALSFQLECEDGEGEESSMSLELDAEGILRLGGRGEVSWVRTAGDS
jgi:hypothetical protein